MKNFCTCAKFPAGMFALEAHKRINDVIVETAPSFDGRVPQYLDIWNYVRLGMTMEQISKIFNGQIKQIKKNELEINPCKIDGREDEYVATFRFTSSQTLEEIVLEAKE